tara:strand:+ start:1646 stop:2116 length:471 start_codon:yes stop_codon:yes gene_type:complete
MTNYDDTSAGTIAWLSMDSPVLKNRSPLRLIKSYDKGLLPTPKIKPLRKVVWVHDPVIELEHVLSLARKERDFSLLNESSECEYECGVYFKFLIQIYGTKIADISHSAEEAKKQNLEDTYSPRTTEIYSMLECEYLKALQQIYFGDRRKFRKDVYT